MKVNWTKVEQFAATANAAGLAAAVFGALPADMSQNKWVLLAMVAAQLFLKPPVTRTAPPAPPPAQ